MNTSEIKQRAAEEWEQTLARLRSNQSYQDIERQYRSLSDRDRTLVNLLFTGLLLYLLYSLVIAPAYSFLSTASGRYQSKLEGYEWMLENKEETKTLVAGATTEREGSLLSIASNVAKNHELSFSRFEPDSDERVRLWLENVKFNSVVSWLGEMELQQGVSASDISVDTGSATGYVNVRLTLRG